MGLPTVVQEIQSPTNEKGLYSALRQLKNNIIGHLEEKEAYLDQNIVPALLEILEKSTDDKSRVQVAQILCSFAHGSDECVDKLLKYPVVEAVLSTLDSSDSPQLLSAILKVLVIIMKARPDPTILANNEAIIRSLTSILTSSNASQDLTTQCYRIIPLLSRSKQSAALLASLSSCLAPRISSLLRQYQQTGQRPQSLEYAIAALANVITEQQARNLLTASTNLNTTVGSASGPSGGKFFNSDKFLNELITLTRDKSPSMRLAAVGLLAELQAHVKNEEQKKYMLQPLLPTLVPVLNMLNEDTRVGLVLASVCRDDEESAVMAVEVGVVKQITNSLKTLDFDDWRNSEFIANDLLALAGIATHQDSFRKAIIDNGGLMLVTKAMGLKQGKLPSSNLKQIKVASCHVLRALARSVASIRTSLDSSEIVDGIVELLRPATANFETKQDEEDDLEIKTAVMAAVCNLILEFSPLKKAIIERGLMEMIISGVHSEFDPLRLNSVWALKHSMYQPTRESRQEVLNRLTPDYLIRLLRDPDLTIQEQAMDLLRNIICNSVPTIDRLFEEIGVSELFGLLEEKLDTSSIYSNYPAIVQSAIYTLVHIASGSEAHRDIISQNEGLLRKLILFLGHQSADVRTAVIWLVINLTWVEQYNDTSRGEQCRLRAQKLVSLGFQKELNDRIRDPMLDIRERTKTALHQLEKLVDSSGGVV